MLQSNLMSHLVFSTGNAEKFLAAKHTCDLFGINIEQRTLDIVEIQDENPENVALDKAQKAFDIVKQPVVITDDSWAILGLNGFPGIYMHSINEWFTPEDFLRLTQPLKDRRVMLTQYLVFTDGTQPKIFTRQTEGALLPEVRGSSPHPSHTIMTLPGDNGLSIAEAYSQVTDKSTRRLARIWHEFAEWYSKK